MDRVGGYEPSDRGSTPLSRTSAINCTAMKLGLVMGALVEPLPELAGSSNEREAFIHDYALNG